MTIDDNDNADAQPDTTEQAPPSASRRARNGELQPGYVTAVVVRTTTKASGFLFARSSDNNEYFVHRAVVDDKYWQALDVGDVISFRWSWGPKGRRAHQVRAASAEERATVEVNEEFRGNQ